MSMSVVSPEVLVQTSDFHDPTVLDIFAHEAIFDTNGFPYVSMSPADYHPNGPQMQLDLFATDDITGRKERGGIVNSTEVRNAQKHFGQAMDLLRTVRSAFVVVERGNDEPLTNSEALRIAHMGIELPRYLLWRKGTEYQNGELPPESILLNRALRGFHSYLSAMSWGATPSTSHRLEFMEAPFSAQDTFDSILDKNALENDLVCAGHINMIGSMLGIIEGSAEQPDITTAEVPFEVVPLMNFAKSMRTVWDMVYPNMEAGLVLIHDAQQDNAPDDNERAEDIRDAFHNAITLANMANMLISTVIGQPEHRTLGLNDLMVAFKSYALNGSERGNELKTRINEFAAGQVQL